MTDSQAPIRINLADADTVKCDNCGDERFEPVYFIKRLSPLISPTGKEEIIPIGPPITNPIFACYSCGFVNQQFIPGPLRSGARKESGETTDTPQATGENTSDENPSGLKIIK